VMATAAGTQDESAPEDHGDDENDASQGDDHGRKPKCPATSVPPVPPVWRFGGCTRLLSCSCRLSRMFSFSHRSQHAPQSQECAVRMRRRDLRSREPFAAIAYLDYHDVTKVNWCPWPPTPREAAPPSASRSPPSPSLFVLSAGLSPCWIARQLVGTPRHRVQGG
jgi:hypothetical protein